MSKANPLPHITSLEEIWARHGYRLERVQQPMGAPRRNVYAPDGQIVLADTDSDEETEYLQQHGMLPSSD
ncbi:hypothetical protein [Comamonas terrae]|uniref:Uncharacterized protein n=1 Tax=Comamonas terrae TaxID=673548 RepID=A0ABW5UTC6_9BURK|nr:hypothetical protein [Comamonas terrae]